MELFHDIPRFQGVSNVIKRARQLVELRWTPLAYFPRVETPEAAATGSVVIEGMSELQGRGDYGLVLVFRNKYGFYISKSAPFFFDGNEV